MTTGIRRRRRLVIATTLATSLVVLAAPGGSQAAASDVDPAALARGKNPAITHLVRNTIRDGALRVPATKGQHIALWNTARGYVLQDALRGGDFRLVQVARNGDKRLITRRASFTVAVSGQGRRVAWDTFVGPVEGPPSVVTVVNPDTGRVIASRRFAQGAHVVAVTGSRVLLARISRPRTNGTLWWNYEKNTLRPYADQSAVAVDFRNNRVVFDIPRDAPACNRVASFTRPSHTLWKSCLWYPEDWSPDGRHAVSTHTYFDAAGTNRWRVIDGRTGERLSRVTGRLDWQAVWEDDRHFLTMAVNEAGAAAVIRCDLDSTCERASRLWDVTLGPDDFYVAPPVVLAEN